MVDLVAEGAGSFVDGRWVGGTPFEVENPADCSTVCTAASASPSAVERALDSSRRSFDSGEWSERSPAERAATDADLIDHVEHRHDELVATMVAEAGQLRTYAEFAQFAMGIDLARTTVELYLALDDEAVNDVPVDELVRGRVALSVRRLEPVGVVTAITPFNGAVIMAVQKIVPALLTGNSVNLRPSPLTPLSSRVFAEAAEAAGLPPGVLNVVVEDGSDAAERLTSDERVDMVSFTGSTSVGRRIASQAAATVKRVALELGGKSAQIYLADAVDRAPAGGVSSMAIHSGQACVAATRMLVPSEQKAEVLDAVTAAIGALVVGPPSDDTAMVGPLIDAAAVARCQEIVDRAERDGAKVVVGGTRPPHLGEGHYFEPTVLDVPDNSNPAAQEEIFGPVLCVMGYRDPDDAVRIANDSQYGLSGQVFGSDTAAATELARRLRTGSVNVNTMLFSAYAPGGGFKQSGLGRERGVEGIRCFQEVKHMAIGELR